MSKMLSRSEQFKVGDEYYFREIDVAKGNGWPREIVAKGIVSHRVLF